MGFSRGRCMERLQGATQASRRGELRLMAAATSSTQCPLKGAAHASYGKELCTR